MKMNTTFLSISAVLGLMGTLFFWSCIPFNSTANQTHKKVKLKALEDTLQFTAKDDSIITITAVGDMMLGTNFPSNRYLPGENVNLLKPMYPFFQYQDIVFGNLEGTLLNEGGDLKKCNDSTKCYAFRQPEYMLSHIQSAGFNLLSVANNHMGDFGELGRSNTLRLLREKGIKHAGLERCPWDTLTVKGKVVGFIAFAPNSECLRIENLERAGQLVRELDEIADIIIVSFHGGAEGSNHTHVTRETEIFYEEDRGNVYQFARTVIDAGADVVLGHGPHVPRAIDMYKDRFITYSMGNFCTYARFNLKGPNGIAPLYQLKIDLTGQFIGGKLISIKQEGEGGPELDPTEVAYTLVKTLTKTDIPEAQLNFPGKGVVLPVRVKN